MLKKRQKEIIEHLFKTNKKEYNLAKAAEELSELSLVLQQKALKPTKVDDQEILDEIGDVIIRLKVLKKMFNKDKIKLRITHKLTLFEGYINKGLYKGGI